MSRVRAFFAFWYDFLVGDRWELFVGPIVALLVVGALLSAGVSSAVAGLLLAALVAAIGGLSVVLVVRGR